MKHSTRRLLSLTLAIVLFAAAFIVFVSLVRPSYEEAQKAKGEVLSREQFLDDQKAAVEQVRNLITAYQGEGDFKEVVALALPPHKNQGEVVHQIERLAAANQLVVQSLTIEDRGAGEAQGRSSARAKAESSIVTPLGSFAMRARIAGTYENFRTFLENIETNIRVMDVESVGVSVAAGQEISQVFDLSFVTYYQNP